MFIDLWKQPHIFSNRWAQHDDDDIVKYFHPLRLTLIGMRTNYSFTIYSIISKWERKKISEDFIFSCDFFSVACFREAQHKIQLVINPLILIKVNL